MEAINALNSKLLEVSSNLEHKQKAISNQEIKLSRLRNNKAEHEKEKQNLLDDIELKASVQKGERNHLADVERRTQELQKSHETILSSMCYLPFYLAKESKEYFECSNRMHTRIFKLRDNLKENDFWVDQAETLVEERDRAKLKYREERGVTQNLEETTEIQLRDELEVEETTLSYLLTTINELSQKYQPPNQGPQFSSSNTSPQYTSNLHTGDKKTASSTNPPSAGIGSIPPYIHDQYKMVEYTVRTTTESFYENQQSVLTTEQKQVRAYEYCENNSPTSRAEPGPSYTSYNNHIGGSSSSLGGNIDNFSGSTTNITSSSRRLMDIDHSAEPPASALPVPPLLPVVAAEATASEPFADIYSIELDAEGEDYPDYRYNQGAPISSSSNSSSMTSNYVYDNNRSTCSSHTNGQSTGSINVPWFHEFKRRKKNRFNAASRGSDLSAAAPLPLAAGGGDEGGGGGGEAGAPSAAVALGAAAAAAVEVSTEPMSSGRRTANNSFKPVSEHLNPYGTPSSSSSSTDNSTSLTTATSKATTSSRLGSNSTQAKNHGINHTESDGTTNHAAVRRAAVAKGTKKDSVQDRFQSGLDMLQQYGSNVHTRATPTETVSKVQNHHKLVESSINRNMQVPAKHAACGMSGDDDVWASDIYELD